MKVTAVMPESVKERLKTFADSKRWTMSQALVYFAEKGLAEELEDDEVDANSTPTDKKK